MEEKRKGHLSSVPEVTEGSAFLGFRVNLLTIVIDPKDLDFVIHSTFENNTIHDYKTPNK